MPQGPVTTSNMPTNVGAGEKRKRKKVRGKGREGGSKGRGKGAPATKKSRPTQGGSHGSAVDRRVKPPLSLQLAAATNVGGVDMGAYSMRQLPTGSRDHFRRVHALSAVPSVTGPGQ